MGTMGWVSMVMFAAIYYMMPRLYDRELYSIPLANLHFWLVLIGQLIFTVSMWIAGVQQAGMWHALNHDGSLTYTFMEVLVEMYPYWTVRLVGGVIYLAGIVVFIYNLCRRRERQTRAVWPMKEEEHLSKNRSCSCSPPRRILVGTIVPPWSPPSACRPSRQPASVTPYTPLRRKGRDVYIREGCNNCHTQTIRPLGSDVLATANTPNPASSSTTGRTCGVRAGPAPTWRASAASTRTPGTTSTWRPRRA